MRAGPEDRKKIREQINRHKKREIQQFLLEVNQKRGSFIMQKKKLYKEDIRKDIIEGKIGGQAKGSNREESSTMSDDH